MKYIWTLLLLWGSFYLNTQLNAYQWPVAAQKVERGFLSEQPKPRSDKALPNLGLWLELDSGDQVKPYHEGEILYFESSSDMGMIGAIPRDMEQSIVVQHGKLLFRYSGEQVEVELQDSYELSSQDKLFTVPESTEDSEDSAQAQLYLEVFDTQFQTIINPKLLLPSTNETLNRSQPFLESITLTNTTGEVSAVNRPLRRRDQLPRGIYNLSFRFPLDQGPPLQLYVSVDDKIIYSELFDQVSGINSRLIINDRDLQDIYIAGQEDSRFLLGTLNLQDKANRSVQLSVDEEDIDGRHNIHNYSLGIR